MEKADLGVNVNIRGNPVYEFSHVGSIPGPLVLRPGFVQLPGVMADGCLLSIKTLLEKSGKFLKMNEVGDPSDLEAKAAFVKAAKNLYTTLAHVQDFYEECKISATDLDHDRRSILIIGWFSVSYSSEESYRRWHRRHQDSGVYSRRRDRCGEGTSC
jgi:hypothetical protein